MPLALSDHQLEIVMLAAGPLAPEKRVVLMERIAAALCRARGVLDVGVSRSAEYPGADLRGLIQSPAA